MNPGPFLLREDNDPPMLPQCAVEPYPFLAPGKSSAI